VFHDDFPTPEQAWKNVKSAGYQPFSLQTVKPEAKKAGADGRGISVSNISGRMTMSDLEWNIDEISEYVVGSTMGMSVGDVESKVTRSLTRNKQEGYVTIQINFDLSGYSPCMDDEFQQRQCDFWAEVFDNEEVKLTHRNYKNAPFVMNELGYRLLG